MGFMSKVLGMFGRGSREPSTPREAIIAFREAVQASGSKWKARTGGNNPEPDPNREIGVFSFFPAGGAKLSAKFEGLGTSSRLEIHTGSVDLLIEYVKGEVSSFYFNREKFDDVHPEVRLNKNLLTELLRDVYRAVGFSISKKKKAKQPEPPQKKK